MNNKTEEEIELEMQAALAEFEQLERQPQTALVDPGFMVRQTGEMPLAALYELMLPITIELGRTRMTIQEVLQLSRGSVIELDRLAGEPVDIYVGDRRFAEGEVVVLGENFGVRITRIFPPSGGTEAA